GFCVSALRLRRILYSPSPGSLPGPLWFCRWRGLLGVVPALHLGSGEIMIRNRFLSFALVLLCAALINGARADEPSLPKACIDGTGPGWRALGGDDFVNVNCAED